MLDQGVELLLQWRSRQALARPPPMHNLPQQPRLAIGPAPDHHPVGTRLFERARRIRDPADVSIDDDRDGYGLFHLADKAPVGVAAVHLVARAAVDGDHLHPQILGNSCQFGCIQTGVVPAHPHFDRSEEHTSELQSLMRISYAVFCLKKKIKQTYDTSVIIK